MANLGTLWFGADIDLTALRNKIQSGNQSILNALKMDYDPASYQQMVSKLRSTLDKETFEIKISTNAATVQRNLQNTLNSVSGGVKAPNLDLSGLKGIPKITNDIINQRDWIYHLKVQVRNLKDEWERMRKSFGEQSIQAKQAQQNYLQYVRHLQNAQWHMQNMQTARQRATLAQSELNKQTQEAAKAARQWNSDHMRLNATLAGGVHISTQLGSALSSLFAIDYARQFLGNVIEIGGQLEKQRISIGAILGDTVKANHLFEQIKGLALKSPFGVVELDQYTKQLSAYGFKYNELYDMTKRLADISAGAGTDIGRLTLALGHVRSATYLTGITLRQFSMNNIPMLKMLADYYTEVEKKAVSTAEVQQRISKRQVSYEDVIEQIRRLTDEGGMFYNMQEKISESLAARYKNLKDAMDIMYGEMAEGSVGDMLKGLADILLKTTRHWKEIANVMGVAAAAFMISKIRVGLNTVAMQSNTAATIKQIMTNKQLAANNLSAAATYRTLTTQERIAIASSNSLTVADIKQAMAVKQLTKEDVLRLIALKELKIAQAMHLVGINGITEAEIRAAAATGRWKAALAGLKMSLKNAFAGIGIGTWATIGAMVGMELYSAWDQWNQRIDDKSNEMKDLIKSRIIDLQKMQKEINTNGKPSDQTALKGRVDEMKQVLANSEAYTKTIDEQLSKTGDLSGQYDILAKAIENAADKNRHMLDYQDDAAKMIKASKGDFEWSDVFKAGILSPSSFKNIYNQLFDEDIVTNIQDVNSAYKELRSTLESLYEFKEPLKEVIEEIMKSSNVSEDLKSQLNNAPFEEQLRILAENGYWDKIKEKIERTGKQFKMSEEEISNVAERLKGSLGKVADEWGEVTGNDIPKMFSKLAEIRGEDEQKTKQWALDNIEDFRMLMDGILDQVGEKEPSVRKAWKRMVYDYLRFSELEKGIAEGAKIGGSVFGNVDLEKLINEDEQATIKDENKTETTKGEKKDKQLEAAKTKLQEYKAFLSEYKKYREIYSKEKAIDLLEQLFPNLKGQGANLVDNYTSMLDKLIFSEKELTESRKKFNNEVNKTKTDTLFDREKESIKKNADAMQEYIKKMEDQWRLYRSLLSKSGGNTQFAQLAFNDNGQLWDDVSKKMLDKFNQRGNELGVIPVGFRWDMNESELQQTLVDAKGQVQTELVKLAQKIQQIIRGNYNKFLEDTAEAYSKTLTTAQKLLDVERQISEKEKERDSYNGDDKTIINGYNIQIKNLEKERNKLKSQLENESGEILQFYSAIMSMTADQAERVGLKIRDNLVKRLQEGEISGEQYLKEIKRIDAQMDKMRKKKGFFEAFRSGGFQGVAELKLDIADDELTDASNKLREAEEALKQAVEANTAAQAGGDTNQIATTEAMVNDAQQAVNVARTNHNTAVTNQKNATKQYNSTKAFASTVSAFAYIIQAWAQAYNDLKDAAAAYGENMDANLSTTGQYIVGTIQGLSTGLSRLQSGDFIGAITGTIFGTIGSIARMHDETLAEDQKNSELTAKKFDNSAQRIERSIDRVLGGIYSVKADQKTLEQLYGYVAKIPRWMIGEDKIVIEVFKKLGIIRERTNNKDTINAINEAIKSESSYDAQLAMLYIQRDEINRQMEDEKQKKNQDASKIEDYRNELEELQEQIEDFHEEMAKALYDIDVKSWAKELGDALFEAWQKGEDGAEAFRKKARSIITDLTKNIAVAKLVETALAPVLKIVTDEMEKKNGRLDEGSVIAISKAMELVGTTLPDSFNALMDGIDQGLQNAGLGSMKDDANESSTTNAIGKAITEQDTSLWASYWNAMRADISVIREGQNVHLPVISAAVQRTSVLAETQVTHLQQIAANTLRNADAADRIYDILHSVAPDGTRIRIA